MLERSSGSACGLKGASRYMDVRITRAMERMRAHMREKLTVEQLAASAGLSPSRFAHLFREQVGVSPVRYLLQLRMDRARALLERTSLSVTEVRLRVGCVWTAPARNGSGRRSRRGAVLP
jgi:transcriptional regulator GlxA family with amidase domain